MNSVVRFLAAVLLIVLVEASGLSLASVRADQVASSIPPAIAARHARIGGVEVAYHVSWAETVLKDPAGVPKATISATTYVRDDGGEAAKRPVVFAFNGGPGASSSPLHFSLLGPRRWAVAAGGARTAVDNEDSLLDVADLVLVDPVGTGFSRELSPGGGKGYWSPLGDAAAVETLIRAWLADHQRASSPVYIIGESYGGFRAAQLARNIGDLAVAGIILISPATDLSAASGEGSDLPFVFELPALAVAAVTHGRVEPRGRTVGQVWEEARAFAQGDYLVALQLGGALPDSERERMAARVSALVGLPASTIAAANLRVSSQDFLEQLVPGRIVGRLDTRVTAAKPEKQLVPGRPKAADDPALGLGTSNRINSPAVRDYLRNEVGVRTEADYISLTLDVNFAWNWNSGSSKFEDNLGFNATPHLAALMRKRPAVRLMVLGGYYDLATPLLGPRHAIAHAGIPLERTEFHALAQGHTVSETDAGRREASALLHRFVWPR
jgi:carboxypeptidase C (cathepsin A)